MPPFTLTYRPSAMRCLTLGGGLLAVTTANTTATPMQKVCETIGLFNAEYLAMSDIPITHTGKADLLTSPERAIYGFSCNRAGRPHCFFIPMKANSKSTIILIMMKIRETIKNFFVKPNEQNGARSNSVMARKCGMKSNFSALPSATGLGGAATMRAAMLLLAVMTATTTWAQTITVVPENGGTYKVDGTKLYVTPNTGFYLVDVKNTGSTQPLEAIAPVGGDPYYSISASVDITITFKAYTKKVRVTFNMNGHGGAAPGVQELTLGQTVTQPTGIASDGNLSLCGWSRNEKGTKPYDFSTPLDNTLAYNRYNEWYTLILYAIWADTSQEYTVKFNGNGDHEVSGGTVFGTMNDVTQSGGSLFTIPECGYSRRNYPFTGWAKSASGGVAFSPGQTIFLTENMTLYAVWEERPTRKIHVGRYEHGQLATDKTLAAEGETVTLTVTPDAGYHLALLYLDDGQSITYPSNHITPVQSSTYPSKYTFTAPAVPEGAADLSVHATFEQDIPQGVTYTIIYNLDGGTVTTENPATYTVESEAITLVNPTKEGYTFAGWTGTGLDTATESVTIGTGSTGDREYTATWTATFTGMALETVEGKLTATFSGTATEALSIPTAIEVERVDIERTFTSGKASTVYLPFTIAKANVTGGTFHTFTSVDETTTPWTVNYTEVTGNIEANTPYIFMPNGSNDGKIVVNNGSTPISVCTANPHTTTQGSWEFIGTYEPIIWTTGHEDLGKVYGFAAEERTNIVVGQFVKVAAGASIAPMRAYLKRTPSSSGARMRGAADELPETMTVVLISAGGEATTIGTITLSNDTDEWYSLDGRKLSGKPTKKGLYIRNGKKTVVK